jgi:hypothetical protein
MEDGEMKKRAMVVAVVTAFVMVGLLAGIAQAAWVTATVSYVGSTGTAYLVKASDTTTPIPLFTNVIFILDPYGTRGKEMYAAALTAFANSTNVQLYVDAYTDYSVAWGCLATK